MKLALSFLAGSLALIAAPASPVAVSAVSRAANVVTVTCATICGIAPNQGFALAGVTDSTFNLDGTAVSGSGTTFTFNQTAANGSSSGGTVLPAKRVIILQINSTATGIQVNGLCWITTTSGVSVSLGSQWSGATAAEVAAINAGTTQEKSLSAVYSNTTTKATIQADLGSQCSSLQTALSTASVQPGQFYGGYFDGTGWSF